jgi:hypothetical protein
LADRIGGFVLNATSGTLFKFGGNVPWSDDSLCIFMVDLLNDFILAVGIIDLKINCIKYNM